MHKLIDKLLSHVQWFLYQVKRIQGRTLSCIKAFVVSSGVSFFKLFFIKCYQLVQFLMYSIISIN